MYNPIYMWKKFSIHKSTNTPTSLNKIYLWFYYTYVQLNKGDCMH